MSDVTKYPAPHEKLDVYKIGCEARKVALAFTESLPPGHGIERRQINKAAASTIRNLCEGASRWKPAEKIHKFEIAVGEAGEAMGAVESLLKCGLGDIELGTAFLALEGRVGAMLTGLIKRQHRR